jgi:tetratricopeptide (TPR) repeat protein
LLNFFSQSTEGFDMGRRGMFRLAVLAELALCWGLVRSGERIFPPEARTKFEEAKQLQEKGQFQDAVNAYEEAIRLGMQAFPRAHLYRANSNLELKEYDKAIAQYSKFIADFSIESSCRY